MSSTPPAGPGDAVPALTGLRGIAALWVLLFHAWIVGGREALGGAALWFNFGWLGVDLFFGLSAFLLTGHALRRRQRAAAAAAGEAPGPILGEPYADYLRRRILRVFPAYYACLTVLLALSAAGRYGPFPSVANVALHLVMLHSLDKHFLDSINGVFWSTPFEWQFYLVLPVLLAVMLRVGGVAFLAIGAAVAIGAYALAAQLRAEFPLAQLTGRLDTFAIGMTAALAVHRAPPSPSLSRASWLAGFALLLLVPVLFSQVPQGFRPGGVVGVVRTLSIDVAVALILIGLAGNEPWGARAIGGRLLAGLGKVSYSVYLVHLPVMLLLADAGAYEYGQSGLLRVLAFALPATLLVAWLAYRFVEAPFLRWGHSARPWRPVFALAAWALVIMAGIGGVTFGVKA